MVWYVYNPHFGWQMKKERDMSTADKKHIQQTREISPYTHRLMVGHRKVDLTTWSMDVFDPAVQIINHKFRGVGNKKYHCVWISACLLVDLINSNYSSLMMGYFRDNQKFLSWLSLFQSNTRQTPFCARNKRKKNIRKYINNLILLFKTKNIVKYLKL